MASHDCHTFEGEASNSGGDRSGDRPLRSDMAFGGRIKAARERKGLSQSAVARHLGVTRQAVTGWESDASNPSTENLVALCDFLGVTLEALTGGMVKTATVSMPSGTTVEYVDDRRPEFRDVFSEVMKETTRNAIDRTRVAPDVPVLGTAVGGFEGDFSFNGQIVDYVRRPPGVQKMKTVYAVYIVGDSMFPRFEEGDLVYVHPDRPPKAGDDVIIEMQPEKEGEPGRSYVKRLVRRTPTKLVCQQFNPLRDDLEYELDAVKRFHRILPWSEVLGI